jgi:hypothetical protein
VLDQSADLRLGAVQADGATVGAQATGQHCEVEHQRDVGEGKLGEIDEDVSLCTDRPRQRTPAKSLSVAILVASAAQRGWFVIKANDARKPTQTASCQTREFLGRSASFQTQGTDGRGPRSLSGSLDSVTWQLSKT